MSFLHEISPEEFQNILTGSARPKKARRTARQEDQQHLFNKLGQLHRGQDSAVPGGIVLTPLSGQAKPTEKIENQTDKRENAILSPENLEKRARNIYFSQGIKRALIHLCPDSELINQYKDSLTCGTIIKKEDDRLTSRYCKNRFCNVCNRIRTGQLLNTYENDIQSLKNPYFGTLTLKNCTAEELPATVRKLVDFWSRFQDNLQKQIKRKKQNPVKGFRKIEITQNAETGEFHPHIHFIVEGRKNALKALNNWLNEQKGEAMIYGQDIQKADSGSMKELFKYVTKLLPRRKRINGILQSWEQFFSDNQTTREFVQGLNEINISLKGVRTFQNFGFTKKAKIEAENKECELTKNPENMDINKENDSQTEDLKDLKGQKYTDIEDLDDGLYFYDADFNGFINKETGEFLFQPRKIPSKLKSLVGSLDKSHENILKKECERSRINKFFFEKLTKGDKFD